MSLSCFKRVNILERVYTPECSQMVTNENFEDEYIQYEIEEDPYTGDFVSASPTIYEENEVRNLPSKEVNQKKELTDEGDLCEDITLILSWYLANEPKDKCKHIVVKHADYFQNFVEKLTLYRKILGTKAHIPDL